MRTNVRMPNGNGCGSLADDGLLKQFAHAIACGRPTRAVVDKAACTLTVYTVRKPTSPVSAGTAVVARCDGQVITGRIAWPEAGWVQINGTAYPAASTEVLGPVLFVARSIAREETDD